MGSICVYGTKKYNTMNRECFYKHENDIYDHNCGRRCLTDRQLLKLDGHFPEMSVDGNLLGARYVYDNGELFLNEEGRHVFCFAESLGRMPEEVLKKAKIRQTLPM